MKFDPYPPSLKINSRYIDYLPGKGRTGKILGNMGRKTFLTHKAGKPF